MRGLPIDLAIHVSKALLLGGGLKERIAESFSIQQAKFLKPSCLVVG
ncbi:hypothetical protein COO91_02834 [Nostoc flagelliforme CCNUN1]|uniref:Uncharacterized protein n=1 Tax=Nostoc flagelliforme CCNUN1 TaxID=2038116 RepID=A0A2K8SQ24_9NOSO|nr:hypothetical protein COO91_02834 [Nostoc flagelliforme CCNUN1]